ncbi:MAG TPA: lipid-A-disaccharide synthase N-terminal domain-containing protein [Rhizomicrobium sp.]|nr:lipid-A-disaccharide synthase N-terminal domain-containing protein [Rhizomicrobium sp.]
MSAHWITPDRLWLLTGLVGQGLFASRFIIQWFRSEREGRSVIPVAFWYCSLGGGVVTLAYTVHLQSVPLTLGQASGLIVYSRNLYLIFRERSLLREAAQTHPSTSSG